MLQDRQNSIGVRKLSEALEAAGLCEEKVLLMFSVFVDVGREF